ncbi:MAG: alcohol dehydrogenase catalytic domain-containing protein [Actinobacteria bacterium]|nr:alcohol dehydrogenase catalytic domain-containing protein [Actinomycetota bacterium]
MKMKAAVCREHGRPITIEDVELAPPRDTEILVRTAFTGFCHTDWSIVSGALDFPLPLVLGHEASGVVEQVGSAVTRLKKGDRVVATWMIPCGTCRLCTSGRGHICSVSDSLHGLGGLLDGTSRLTGAGGEKLHHEIFVSGFAEYMVLPEAGAVKVVDGFPLDQAAVISCCVPTGFGAVENVAKVKPGNSVAIWGMGGVGLNVVAAAKFRRAHPIVGVDLEGRKESIAREMGVTHFVDSTKQDPVPFIKELTDGGAEFCFDVSGDPGAVVQAYWALGMGGTLVMVGIPPVGSVTPLPLTYTPPQNRNILGTLYGNVRTHHDLPVLMRMIMKGEYIDLSKLVSGRFKLDDINDVYDAMTRREIEGRWICEFA